MKKYILFFIPEYDPYGGLDDIDDSFDTIEETHSKIDKSKNGIYQIVDRDTWEIINIERIKKIETQHISTTEKIPFPKDEEYPPYYRIFPADIPPGGGIWGMDAETDARNIRLLKEMEKNENHV